MSAATMPGAGSMATGGGAPPGKGGGGGKKPGGGGDRKSNLYSYPARSAKSFITEWLRARANRIVNQQLIEELAHFLWQLGRNGVTLGPHLRTVANHRNNTTSEMTVASFPNTGETVAQFFGLGAADAPTKRGYYDPNIEAGIGQGSAGSVHFTGNNRCGRCANPGKATLHFGGRCTQSYFNGQLLNWGACNECQMNGNHSQCSFYRKPAVESELSMRNVTETVLRPPTALRAPSDAPSVDEAEDSDEYDLDYTPVLKGKGKSKK